MQNLDPEYVFFKWPLYSPIDITKENFGEFERIYDFPGSAYTNDRVEGHNPFRNNISTTFIGYGRSGENWKYITEYGGIIGISIRCVRYNDVLTYYFHFDLETSRLQKIGQYPSIADLQIQ
ncbi:MAG TPA: hypothetical protein VHS53_11245, partial [Mucilaginibacter sp.]|nr:hypothetical protein [Mucilaginibacter sp.]